MNYYNNYGQYGLGAESFIGYYVNDYNEVLNMAVPSNGQSVLFANLDSGMLWSKKIINGVPVIQPYHIQAIYQEASKPQEAVNNSPDIMKELEAMKAEIAKLKGVKDESK